MHYTCLLPYVFFKPLCHRRIFSQYHMHGVLSRLMFGNAITERWQVDTREHRFASPEHYG